MRIVDSTVDFYDFAMSPYVGYVGDDIKYFRTQRARFAMAPSTIADISTRGEIELVPYGLKDGITVRNTQIIRAFNTSTPNIGILVYGRNAIVIYTEVTSWMDAHAGRENPRIKKVSSFDEYCKIVDASRAGSLSFFLASLEQEWDVFNSLVQNGNALQDFCESLNVPLALILKGRGSISIMQIHTNPIITDYCVPSEVFDVDEYPDVYSSIEQMVVHLNDPTRNIAVPSNEDKVTKHGFDKTSFRRGKK